MYNWNKTIEDQTKLEYIPPGIIDLLPKINCSGICMTLVLALAKNKYLK